MTRRRLRKALVGAALVVALANCGVPTDSEPRRIDSEQVPFGLLEDPNNQN